METWGRAALNGIATHTLASFESDLLVQDAILYRITIVGEAACQLSEEIRSAHPQIPWRDIIGMRNRLVHGYGRVQIERVWKVVERDIPVLLAQLDDVLASVAAMTEDDSL